ncbi:MAG: beta-lactamase family protein [Alphaproteobacteria bacterium]|nr:beta-lactamase family protein [Alphaproteobacteria bacterium]
MAYGPIRLFLITLTLLATNAATAQDTRFEQQLLPVIERELAKPTVPGITLAIGKGDELIFVRAFGVANIETGAPVTLDTKMRVGSVSKVLATALLGKLWQDQKLDLDAPVQQYVPFFPKKRWPVSIRQMAGHMGGIRHYEGDEFLNTRHYRSVTEGLAIFRSSPLEFKPGTQVSYSSYAWNLISAALESAGQTNFLDAMQDQVFRPLGMPDTLAEDTTKPIENLAAFHDRNGIAPFVDNSYKWAGGGFVATARDIARFGLAHTRPGFLKEKTLQLLGKEQSTLSGQPAGFGIGWMTASNMRRRLNRNGQQGFHIAVHDHLIWHSGGSMGGVALLLVDPEEDISIALMANGGDAYPSLQYIGLTALQLLLDNNNTK